MTSGAQQRSTDCGLRIADRGLEPAIRSPISDARNLRFGCAPFAHRNRLRIVGALAAVLALASPSAAQSTGQSPLREIWERLQQRASASTTSDSAAADAGETNQETAASPFADDPKPAPPLDGAYPAAPPTGAEYATTAQPREALPVPQAPHGLSAPRVEGLLPLAGAGGDGDVELRENANGRISLVVRDASLSKVLALLAQTQQLNIVAANDIDAVISITLRDVPLEEALTAILSVANYTWIQRNNIILITSLTGGTNLPPDVQGRQIQVFELDFAAADVVAEAVTNFLSPIGRVTTTTTDPTNNRRTRELVVVEDLPESIARIAAYIEQVDCPPRQVLIEAHILQVNLEDETRNGVDFNALFRVAGATVDVLSVPTLASPLPSGPGVPPATPSAPAFLATIAGSDLQAVIEMLQRTTDSKTLGSPKLLVLNGQEARIQVGETIYYSQTTTTETSTQQGAASVQTGVILRITPRVTQDGRVLLRVAPEVSSPSGDRASTDLPPNISTIDLQSDVMLCDGQGMIIGGLIDERDVTSQQKVPYLGNVKGIGWLFRRTTVTKERTEIIFALVPRVQPYNNVYQAFEQGELVKVGVPLYDGPLCRTDRPWDPILPDGKRVYRPLVPQPWWHGHGLQEGPNSEYVIPPYPLPQQHFRAPLIGPPPQAQPLPLLSDENLPVPAQ